MIAFLLLLVGLLKTAAYEGYPGNLLDRGKSPVNQALGAAGGTYDLLGPSGTNVIQCEQASTLVVEADMSGGASGDLTVAVNPLEADLTTVLGVALPAVQSAGPTLGGGRVTYYGQYDITGVDAVRIRFTNNNVAGQTGNFSWRIA